MPPSEHFWLVIPITVVVSAVTALALIPLAIRFGWVDPPGSDKLHDAATPYLGGPAIFVALVAGAVLSPSAGSDFQRFVFVLLAGGFVLVLAGLVHDLRGLGTFLRFVIQLVACAAVVMLCGDRLHDPGSLFSGDVPAWGWFAVSLTILAALCVINAFRLIDALDGLAGGVFAVAASGMGLSAALAGQWDMFRFLAIALSAVLGFMVLNARLPWNTRARVFLGDSGSLLLGMLLAFCLIRLAGGGVNRVINPMTAVWLFAVPLLDASMLLLARSPGEDARLPANRYQLHHAFLRAGFTVGQTWLSITLLALALAAVGIGLELGGLSTAVGFPAFVALAFVYYFYLKHCWAAQRFLGRHFIYHEFTLEQPYR